MLALTSATLFIKNKRKLLQSSFEDTCAEGRGEEGTDDHIDCVKSTLGFCLLAVIMSARPIKGL